MILYSADHTFSEDFADYINYWKHNGYWLFDSPDLIQLVAAENAIDLREASLFYYEVYKKEFDGENWLDCRPDEFSSSDKCCCAEPEGA